MKIRPEVFELFLVYVRTDRLRELHKRQMCSATQKIKAKEHKKVTREIIETKKVRITTPLSRGTENRRVVQLAIKVSVFHGTRKLVFAFIQLPENKHEKQEVTECVKSVTTLARRLPFI